MLSIKVIFNVQNMNFDCKLKEIKLSTKIPKCSISFLSSNRQLAEIREKEALEKEKTRRDYEKLRLQLDDLAKEEQEVRAASSKVNLITIEIF